MSVMDDRLYRSRSDRMIAGVAGGLAEHYELDPSLVRIGWALLILVTGGLFLLLYIVMVIVVPEEPGVTTPGDRPAWSTEPTPAASAAAASSGVDPSPSASTGSPSADAAVAAAAADPTTGWAAPAGAAPAAAPSGREARRAARAARRDTSAPLIFGAILVLIGALAFAGQVFPALDWDLLWPLVLIVIGVALVVAALRRRPS
jgi:phage shock protein C